MHACRRTNFRQKLQELTTKEANGRLMKNEKRHNSYLKHPKLDLEPIFDADTIITKVLISGVLCNKVLLNKVFQ
jgi:hypothetical protein